MNHANTTNVNEALNDVWALLEDLDRAAVFGRQQIRRRGGVLERCLLIAAAAMPDSRFARDERLAALIDALRDDAINLWRRHKVLERVVLGMID